MVRKCYKSVCRSRLNSSGRLCLQTIISSPRSPLPSPSALDLRPLFIIPSLPAGHGKSISHMLRTARAYLRMWHWGAEHGINRLHFREGLVPPISKAGDKTRPMSKTASRACLCTVIPVCKFCAIGRVWRSIRCASQGTRRPRIRMGQWWLGFIMVIPPFSFPPQLVTLVDPVHGTVAQ